MPTTLKAGWKSFGMLFTRTGRPASPKALTRHMTKNGTTFVRLWHGCEKRLRQLSGSLILEGWTAR